VSTQALFDHLVNQSERMTQEWFRQRSKLTKSYYAAASKSVSEHINKQNRLFIQTITRVLINPEEALIQLNEWAKKVAQDRVEANVPLGDIIHQFKLFREIYLGEIGYFVMNSTLAIELPEFFTWNRIINRAFDDVIEVFNERYYQFSLDCLKVQKELIDELGSPVISIKPGIAVLPLIGSIDQDRAKTLLPTVLKQTAEKRVNRLFIDLSGVAYLDTAVAQKIFQVIDSLRLIGVEAVLSGVRPEIAQTAILLGIDFSSVKIESNLERALAGLEKNGV